MGIPRSFACCINSITDMSLRVSLSNVMSMRRFLVLGIVIAEVFGEVLM